MAKKDKAAAETFDEVLDDFVQDKPEPIMTDEEVHPSPFEQAISQDEKAEEAEHERHTWRGAIAEMGGKADADVHAVHMRLAEIKPFLDGAIKKSEGNVKSFLEGLKAHL